LRIRLIVAILFSTGCAVRQPVTTNWRLTSQGTGDLLIPPGVSKPDLATRTFAVDLPAGRGPCPPTIRVKGSRVFVSVTRATLLQHPQGWLTMWAADVEAQGCIAPGGGSRFAQRIAESLPLDPTLAFHLLYANDRQNGRVDIAPPVRLQVVSPILRNPAAADTASEVSGNGNTLDIAVKASDNLVGYETAWYAAQSRPEGIGSTIIPLYAERHLQDRTERIAQPATNYLQFPADAKFYRLFYKSGQTDYTALVVAATTRAELDRRSALLNTPATSCDQLCVAIPRRVAINPMVSVTVNDAEAMVAWGATVAEAIRGAGERQPTAVLPKLAVSRLYNGYPTPVDFDRSSPAILRLPLTGGEVIAWN
jgi:hypothetical protein